MFVKTYFKMRLHAGIRVTVDQYIQIFQDTDGSEGSAAWYVGHKRQNMADSSPLLKTPAGQLTAARRALHLFYIDAIAQAFNWIRSSVMDMPGLIPLPEQAEI